MKSSGLYSLLTILNESIKLLSRNGKLMALIASFSIFFSLCFSSLFSYSIQSLMADIIVTVQKSFMPDPASFDPDDPTSFAPKTDFGLAQIAGLLNHLQGDFAIILAVELAFFLAFSIIYFISSVSTILASAHSYSGNNLSLKELLSLIYNTWTKPLITTFYVSCLSSGYSVTVFFLTAPLLMCPNISTFWVSIIVGVPFITLYLYLSVPWFLSIVISVTEESCYGMEGLGKAAALVKGKRLHGFLLNVLYGLLLSVIFTCYQMLVQSKGLTIALMFLSCVLSLVKMFQTVAYTVLYRQCKEQHGEEIKLHGSVQYSKLTVLANDMA